MSEKIFIWCYLTTATTCRVWVKPLRLSVYTKIQHSMQWTLSATAGRWSCLVLESIIPRVPVLAVLVNLRFLQLPASSTKELFVMGLRRLFSRQEAASTGDLVPVSFPSFPLSFWRLLLPPVWALMGSKKFFLFLLILCLLLRSGSTVPAACTIPGIMFGTWSTKPTLVLENGNGDFFLPGLAATQIGHPLWRLACLWGDG